MADNEPTTAAHGEPRARAGRRPGTFRSLANRNYRLWALGGLVSNVGTWMQRTAQDWLVLTALTHHDAAAVGIVSALQFGPLLLLLPWTGLAADRFDRRRLLIATQTAMGVLALGLGLLTIGGVVRLWEVYGFAFGLGCASAFDAPVRQAFVSELVGEDALSNAVALNSMSFNAARLVGPAIAGLLIAASGTGAVFLANAASYGAVLASLACLRVGELHGGRRDKIGPGGLAAGFRYVGRRPDLQIILVMLFLLCTFGFNFPIYISTMSASVFHLGAGRYGMLASAMAVGSVAGAALSARRETPTSGLLVVGAALFGAGMVVAALMPDPAAFGLVLVGVGIAAQTVLTTGVSLVQLTTESAMRGRVMAILLAMSLGGTPVGAPLIGAVANRYGPRAAMFAGGIAGLAAAAIGAVLLRRRARGREGVPAAPAPPGGEMLAPPGGDGDRLGGRAGPV